MDCCLSWQTATIVFIKKIKCALSSAGRWALRSLFVWVSKMSLSETADTVLPKGPRLEPLTDTACRGAKPDPAGKTAQNSLLWRALLGRLAFGGGALWRIRCRFDAKERLLWFGAKPETPLAHPRALAVRGNRHPASSPCDGSRHGSRRASCGAICKNGARDDRERQTRIYPVCFPGSTRDALERIGPRNVNSGLSHLG